MRLLQCAQGCGVCVCSVAHVVCTGLCGGSCLNWSPDLVTARSGSHGRSKQQSLPNWQIFLSTLHFYCIPTFAKTANMEPVQNFLTPYLCVPIRGPQEKVIPCFSRKRHDKVGSNSNHQTCIYQMKTRNQVKLDTVF